MVIFLVLTLILFVSVMLFSFISHKKGSIWAITGSVIVMICFSAIALMNAGTFSATNGQTVQLLPEEVTRQLPSPDNREMDRITWQAEGTMRTSDGGGLGFYTMQTYLTTTYYPSEGFMWVEWESALPAGEAFKQVMSLFEHKFKDKYTLHDVKLPDSDKVSWAIVKCSKKQ